MIAIIKYLLYIIAIYFIVISIYDFETKTLVFSKLYLFIALVCFYLTTLIKRAEKQIN